MISTAYIAYSLYDIDRYIQKFEVLSIKKLFNYVIKVLFGQISLSIGGSIDHCSTTFSFNQTFSKDAKRL